jgi:type III secretion protein J
VEEKEANEIVVFLANQGIPAEKRAIETSGAGGGADSARRYSVYVPGAQRVEAIAILNKHGFPRRPGPSLLSLFAKSGLVSSASEEQIRFQEGLGEQIASVIRKIDGVVDANVQISTPQELETYASPDQVKQPVRASVYVKHSGILDDPNSQLITKIKRLVAASVVGLDYDNVTVVADRSRYTDVQLDGLRSEDEERDWVQVWSIIMAKGSASRFRTLFFSLCFTILLLAVFIVWILWKLFPLIQEAGGIGKLFSSVKPLYVSEKPKEEEEPPPPPPEEEGEG